MLNIALKGQRSNHEELLNPFDQTNEIHCSGYVICCILSVIMFKSRDALFWGLNGVGVIGLDCITLREFDCIFCIFP